MLHFASPGQPGRLPRDARSRRSRSGASGRTTRSGIALAKGARFLLASTSEVYGDPLVHPQPESYWGNVNPIGPRGVLRRGQALRRGDDDGVSPRTTGSTRASSGSSTPTARACGPATAAWCRTSSCRRCAGDPLTVYGDGSQTRSFCYVERRGRRHLPALPFGRGPIPMNIGNPERVHDPRARGRRAGGDGERVRAAVACRSRRTIRRCASRTSPWHATCSVGSRRFSCGRGSGRRSRTSVTARTARCPGEDDLSLDRLAPEGLSCSAVPDPFHWREAPAGRNDG